MSYSSNPLLPRARAQAVRLVVEQKLPMSVAARKSGIHRTTLWRWKRKWLRLNEYVQLANTNRPHRRAGSVFRRAALRWLIPTESSRPRSCPHAVSDAVVNRVLELRRTLKRCAEVVWYHLAHIEAVHISLSSVRRILRRFQLIRGRRPRLRRDNPVRPQVSRPGELVQTDTVHYVCPLTKKRRYVYTVIDLYTRMAYAAVCDRIGPGIAASIILRASTHFGFAFHMVQADNGPEFGRYFEQTLVRRGVLTRHSRLHRPNDNAHIERFNRTIQEECLGRTLTYKDTNNQVQARLTQYLDFYNTRRVHLGLQFRTPQEMLQSS
jgi:transposase InsO family protein